MLARLGTYLSWWDGLSREERDRFLRDLRDKKITDSKKTEIKTLAKHWLHKNNVSWNCGSCLMDAHILLVRLKIEDMEKKTTEYALVTGTILHDPINKDFSLILMPPKLTEELALYHLAFNPLAAQRFTATPADLDKRIAEYLAGVSEELRAKALPPALAAFNKYAPAPAPEPVNETAETEQDPAKVETETQADPADASEAKPKSSRTRRAPEPAPAPAPEPVNETAETEQDPAEQGEA